MSRIDRGRADLAAWVDAQPRNFWTADVAFQRLLRRIGGDAWMERMTPRLERTGREVAEEMDPAAEVNNRPHNLPRLEGWDRVGRRTEDIEHHPSYHIAGRVLYESGMMGDFAEPGGFLRSLALMYLTSHCGEAGHNCPSACTAGIIRSVQALAPPELKEKLLPRLYSDRYSERWDGAQFLTEVQGGSDVGANDTRAHQTEDGTWRIRGEKWFCSNADADLILMTARFDDETRGTSGLGLFLVPRRLDDGRINDFTIRRLKDKLGTRSMPSGEMDFQDAFAWCLGEPQDGFRHMMRYVINTSRVYNAVAVAGIARRSAIVAQTYARHRSAFGRPIGQFSLIRDTVAGLVSESEAINAGTFALLNQLDRADAGALSSDEQAALRFAINVNKVRTSKSATESARDGIEVLGGNGAIESFSILPRLLRDAIVCENWEGTHNTLTAQVLRDMHRYRQHEPFLTGVRAAFAALPTPECLDMRQAGLRACDAAADRLAAILTMDEARASLSMKPMVDELSWLLWAGELATQAAWELDALGDPHRLDVWRFFWNRRFPAFALDADDVSLAARVSGLADA